MSSWWFAALAVGAVSTVGVSWTARRAQRERRATAQLGDELAALRRVVAEVAGRVPRPRRGEQPPTPR